MSLKDSLRVMVVDDMSTSRGILTQCLDELGVSNYMVENNGQSAFQKLVANPVHLVLSDYNMPGMDGLGLLKALREHRVTQRVGFILVTGKPTPEIVEVGRRLAMNNIIRKPFTVATMKQAIEQVVGRL
ncbi:response regulator (plasmid) [Phaeobacter inhibens]|uniref:Response regulator receiver domain-containing protein n=5 Tax=Phaeobacter TaxID=302485 RepID=A0AAC9ZCX2_9RHOB|nr:MULTISPECIES: response regulator [Phaeobacter]AFO89605.1 response regulator receiver -like protein [Phaeobacter inhibens 2.10]AFO93490.1 response regulator receiver domain-containing protein [Phaeobacter inhibens DSM 17395]AHD11636.1 Response regulator [Phaeobacter gallaeciensis DSM 26640]APG49085.1 response regulator receiver domain-containing protein [Phaeobacter porticola]APX17782.1 response regulator [Phaeobacter inhibens]